MCVFMSTCVCVHVCLRFEESVHSLNACLCYVRACACECVNQYVCSICIVKTRPMCAHVATFKPI